VVRLLRKSEKQNKMRFVKSQNEMDGKMKCEKKSFPFSGEWARWKEKLEGSPAYPLVPTSGMYYCFRDCEDLYGMEIQESGKSWRVAAESLKAGPWIQLGISNVSHGNFSGWPPLYLDYDSTDRNLMDEVFWFGASTDDPRSNAEHVFLAPISSID
jgi:hypothetical protein